MIGFSPTIDIGDRTFQRTYGSSHIRSLVVYIMTTGSKRRSRDPGPIMFADHWEDPQERVLAESRGLACRKPSPEAGPLPSLTLSLRHLPVRPLRVCYDPTVAFSASRMAIRFGLATSLLGSRSSSTPALKLAWIFSASTVVGSWKARSKRP
jgi:hypothetical protein